MIAIQTYTDVGFNFTVQWLILDFLTQNRSLVTIVQKRRLMIIKNIYNNWDRLRTAIWLRSEKTNGFLMSCLFRKFILRTILKVCRYPFHLKVFLSEVLLSDIYNSWLTIINLIINTLTTFQINLHSYVGIFNSQRYPLYLCLISYSGELYFSY